MPCRTIGDGFAVVTSRRHAKWLGNVRLSEYLRDLLVILALFLSAGHQWSHAEPELYHPLLLVRAYAEGYETLGERRPDRTQD